MDTKNLAVMSFDGTHLLLPQQGVQTIEVIGSMNRHTDTPGVIGVLKLADREWPAFALTANFKPYPDFPESYKFCVAFNLDSEAAFTIICEEVSTVTVVDVDEIKPLQTCMRTPGNPIEALLLRDNKLMMVSDIETMQQFLLRDVAA